MLQNSNGKILPQMFAKGFIRMYVMKSLMKTASGLGETKILPYLLYIRNSILSNNIAFFRKSSSAQIKK